MTHWACYAIGGFAGMFLTVALAGLWDAFRPDRHTIGRRRTDFK